MKYDVTIYLADMLEQIEIIESELPAISRDEFFSRPFFQNALIRSLEIIGEAAKQIPGDIREEHPEIPWKQITGMRDKLAHGYATVDLNATWNTVIHDIPPLREYLKALLERL